jgi:hypothetical protein
MGCHFLNFSVIFHKFIKSLAITITFTQIFLLTIQKLFANNTFSGGVTTPPQPHP